MTTPTSKRTGPIVYMHSTRAEWGRAVVAEVLVDRTTYLFENVGPRTFLHGSSVIVETDVTPEERSALAAALVRATGAAAPKKKRAPRAKKAAPTPTSTPTDA